MVHYDVAGGMNAAERIYEAVARDGASAALRGELLARRIEEDIASGHLQAGDSLGSVRVLAARYGVGRPAVCEAVRILERRGLGRMRTGRSGGLILSRPALEAAAGELADFARLSGFSLRQLLDAREAVDGAAARLAAERRPPPSELERLRQAAADQPALTGDLAARGETARLTADPAIQLFVRCLDDLTLDYAATTPSAEAPAWPLALASALAEGDGRSAAGIACASLDELRPLLADADGSVRGPLRLPAGSGPQQKRSSAVAEAMAADLSRLGGAGARLGSEWELCERYGVGRPILRQAIRTLEDRGMVECRRGRGQGLMARALQPNGAIRQAVAFLMAETFDPARVGKLLCLLNVASPALAVSRAGADQRRRLARLLRRIETRDPVARADHLDLVRCVAELSDVPMVDVFCRCLVAYEARFRRNLPETFSPGARHPYIDHVRRLLSAAPLDGDALRQAKAETAEMMLDLSRCSPP